MKALISSGWALALLGAFQPVYGQDPYKVQTPPLDTDWTYKVGTDPWPEHPRPQLRRDAWQSLNGLWTWKRASGASDANSPPSSGPLDKEVLVPSCIESALSGLQILDARFMWYETTFDVPKSWDQNVLLNFEAIDYTATVYLNGVKQGTHVGGYSRYTIDVTKDVKVGESNELLVFVHDPTDGAHIPIGKQTLNPSHIFYRSCSGIWQSVWIESAPADHITQLDVAASHKGEVTINAHSASKEGASVDVGVYDAKGRKVATASGTADKEFKFTVKRPELWWPDSPTLYNLKVKLGDDDEVSSYTGFRTVSKGKVNGVVRPLLNGEFVFLFGTLDQGYWPDGLHTPPNREAMEYDIKMLKKVGFNMLRKHIKIENDLFYHSCDRLGLMVIQDMPSFTPGLNPNAAEQAEFQRQLEIMVNEHKSYPSIITWMIFNEGWGQLDNGQAEEGPLTEVVRSIDPSRLIISVSGWDDHGFGDFHDNHAYAAPQCGTPFYSRPKTPYDHVRIGIQGEYGGIGHNVSIEHLWNVKQAIDSIPETYEINADLESYNWRSKGLFRDIREQTEVWACSGAVYTQTTDVEGEVNGLLTYDRRVLRPNLKQWQADVKSVYKAAHKRGGRKVD